jgi:riboflavin kinase/FMN adenylyltransferase
VKIYRGFYNYSPVKNAIVTTGTFDGVHVGHKTIIERLKGIARKYDGESVLITFYPHPRLVLQKNSGLKLLSTIEERIELLEESGIDHLIIIPFDKEFAKLSSTQFVEDILVKKVGTKRLVIGYDHHFGRNREGSLKHLLTFGPKYGFEVEEIPALEVDRVNVSSTIIREALLKGQVGKAMDFLEHPYTLKGVVVEGNQIGRSIGFPTANIKIKENHKLIPKQGVYAVYVKQSNIFYQGMLNIGRRPTVGFNNDLTIEVNIFDFNKSIYGEELRIEIMQHVRNEIHFSDVNALKTQLEQDLKACKKILSLK